MFRFFAAHKLPILIAAMATVLSAHLLFKHLTHDPLAGLTTTTVERGTVEDIVSVSGVTDAPNTALLAFAAAGVVSDVYVVEGDDVKRGDVLASVGAEALVADRARALATLRQAEIDRDELIAGARPEERAVTAQTVATAQADLARTTQIEDTAVENARRALYSEGLAAQADDPNEDAVPPAITGTYRCTKTGTYTLTLYNSRADSGYSMHISGLETGTHVAATQQPSPFGTCGLFAQFDEDSTYGNSVWTVDIPNTAAASYPTLKSTYEAARTARDAKIAAAVDAVTLAERKANLANAAPRAESLARAEATVAAAEAALDRIDAELGDRIVTAPFDGTVTDVSILPGETAGSAPVFTLLARDNFELKARIPEIDITKLVVGQQARVMFDARPNQTFTATVRYIAPLPTQIDGVAYFEVTLDLDQPPEWIRGGLNADIDITIDAIIDTLRVPKRYVIETDNGSYVRTFAGSTVATSTVTVTFVGNDGFVAIAGLTEGALIVAP